ncbi:HEAT repeat domain-containing protein [uncultured Roseibium sp.]|uniref:HEAT repeat domain-containing protein n=1 Tax=uncultured Roseibium sp. TaxID=1936171 RepID=UPI00263201B9|nr:HEAT repeat domain-containing protein [uncultured Roseibium sp.]
MAQPKPSISMQPEALVLGSDLENTMLQIVQSGSPAEQCLAIKAAGEWKLPSARNVLLEATRNDDPDIRVDALQTLVKLGGKGLGETFLWSLQNDPVSESKIAALNGLQPEDRELAAPLLRKLAVESFDDEIAWEDENADWDDWLDVQKEAIRTIGRLGIEEALDDMLTAAKDEFGQELWREVFEAYAGLGRPGFLALLDAGQSSSDRQRARAARALGASSDPHALKALDGLCQDKSVDVRLAALETMLERSAPVSDTRLIEDSSALIRSMTAAKSPTISVDDLIGLVLHDDDRTVRLAAINRLKDHKLKPSQLAKLLDLAGAKLRGEREDFVSSLVDVLGRSESDEAFEALLEIKAHNPKPEVQRAVLSAFEHFRKPEVLEQLADGITSKSQMVRLSALATVAALSEGEGAVADNAAAILLLAAQGDLVSEETDAENEEKEGAEEEHKQFGARARDDDGGTKNRIVLDREGNIVPQDEVNETNESGEPVKLSDYRRPETQGDDADDPDQSQAQSAGSDAAAGETPEETAEIVVFPQSTLAAILQGDVEQAEFTEEKIDLSDEDLKFLELAQSTLKKKRVRPDVAPNAGLEIRRIAVRLIGEQKLTVFTPVLLAAMETLDDELRVAALTALATRSGNRVTLSHSDWSFLVNLPPDNYAPSRAALLDLLSFAPDAVAAPHFEAALSGNDPADQAAALKACMTMQTLPPQIGALLQSDDRTTRRAALKGLCASADGDAADALLEAAFRESGALWSELSGAVGKRGACDLTTRIMGKLQDACEVSGAGRIIALEILADLGKSTQPA